MRWVVGAAADAAVDLYAAYAMPNGPFVRANFATSVDGRVELEGVSKGVSSDIDREVFHVMRALCDVVLAGAQTVRAESYGPARPTAERIEIRRAYGYADVPPIAVVTRSGRLDPSSALFTEAKVRTIVLAPERSLPDLVSLRDVAEVVVCGDTEVEPALAVAALAVRGLGRVLCEGGPRLHHALLEAGQLDELCLTLSPLTAGGNSQRLAVAPLTPPVSLPIRHVLEHEGSLFLRCRR